MMALDRRATARAIARVDAMCVSENCADAAKARQHGVEIGDAKRAVLASAQVSGQIAWFDSPDPAIDAERGRGVMVIAADGALVRVSVTPGRARSLIAWLVGLLE